MNLSGNRFVYGGVSSRDYGGLFFAHADTEELRQMCAEHVYRTVYLKSDRTHYISGSEDSGQPLTFELEIIRETPIPRDEAREIAGWLFHSPDYQKLYLDEEDDTEIEITNGTAKRTYLNCIFYNPYKITDACGLRGWRCTCRLAAPMALQDATVFTADTFDAPLTVSADTDGKDYIYPSMVLVTGSTGGDMAVTNQTDGGRSMTLTEIPKQKTIYINTAAGIITDDAANSYYSHVTQRKFPRLLPGENVLSVSGDIASLRLTWNNERWI